MYFIIFSLSFQYGAKIKRICFYLATPQSTLSTAPLYGSLICLSLRRGAQRTEWWFRTGQHLDVTFQHYHGRPMVAPTTVFHLCSPFSLATSVDFVDSSPLWEPYMPLLEERCPKGGMVVSYRTMTSTPISSPPPSVDFVDSSPLWEPYMPLLEERWHAVSEWWFRVERHP